MFRFQHALRTSGLGAALGTALLLASTTASALTLIDVQGDLPSAPASAIIEPFAFYLDASFVDRQPIRFTFQRNADDPGAFSFGGVARALSPFLFPGLQVALEGGATLGATLGSLESIGAQTVSGLNRSATSFQALVSPASSELYFGDPLLSGGIDWTVNVGALVPGASFSVVLTPVPEPGIAALTLAGLGVVAWRRRTADGGGGAQSV